MDTHGILQSRILESVAFPFSRGSSQPRDRTQISHIAGRFFTSWATREAIWLHATAAAAKSLQSCRTLCDPIEGSPPGSPVPGILQARTLEWVAISFSNAWKWKVKVSRLVVSDPQRPHGLQPTRLLRPWDFPGKSTGVGCHCLLRSDSIEMNKLEMEILVLEKVIFPLTDFLPNPLSMFQAKFTARFSRLLLHKTNTCPLGPYQCCVLVVSSLISYTCIPLQLLDFNVHKFAWTPGVGDGQGGLVCCDSWGHKESDTTEWLNWTELKN